MAARFTREQQEKIKLLLDIDKEFTTGQLDKLSNLFIYFKGEVGGFDIDIELKTKNEALKKEEEELRTKKFEFKKGEVGSYKIKWEQDVFSKSGKTYKLMMYNSFKNLKICYISDNKEAIDKYIIDNLDNILARSYNEKLKGYSTKS